MFRRHPVLSIATIAYLGIVGWVTLGPQPLDDSGRSILHQLVRFLARHDATGWITESRIEFGANVAMFIPIGMFFLLLLGRRRWWFAFAIAVCLTVGIEVSQQVLPTRVPDIRDIVANSTGALVGILAALLFTIPGARRSKLAAEHKRLRSENISLG
ncbi:MAG: VanZ family protein [Rhodoglobus sp.]